MDEGGFISFLVAQGYSVPEAGDLVDQVIDDDTDYLDITTRDGLVVTVKVDSSMGFAGQVQFIVPGETAR